MIDPDFGKNEPLYDAYCANVGMTPGAAPFIFGQLRGEIE
jgi:hypothetical protein